MFSHDLEVLVENLPRNLVDTTLRTIGVFDPFHQPGRAAEDRPETTGDVFRELGIAPTLPVLTEPSLVGARSFLGTNFLKGHGIGARPVPPFEGIKEVRPHPAHHNIVQHTTLHCNTP